MISIDNLVDIVCTEALEEQAEAERRKEYDGVKINYKYEVIEFPDGSLHEFED